MEIVFPAPLEATLNASIFPEDKLEACALLITKPALRGGRQRHLVQSVVIPTEDHYLARAHNHVTLSTAFYVPLVGSAVYEKSGLCFVHSHPMSDEAVSFSAIDDAGEAALARYFSKRAPNLPVHSIVYGATSRAARALGTNKAARLTDIGSSIRTTLGSVTFDPTLFDRQVRAFGADGQKRLSSLTVGIVGLGGTGSLVAAQLAFLGVNQFVLIDPDSLEETNRNRVIGANQRMIGKPKVDVAAASIRSVNPKAKIVASKENVLTSAGADLALSCDFLFGCTDSHGSRSLLNQIAYQYLIPCIDMGVALEASNGAVTRIVGRSQLLAPGLPCLACCQTLDPEAVRLDFMPEDVRMKEPYFRGDGPPQPAVISINGTMASLSVTMFLGTVTGVPTAPRMLQYDGIRGTVRPTSCGIVADCIVCSNTRGALSQGDSWPLPSLP